MSPNKKGLLGIVTEDAFALDPALGVCGIENLIAENTMLQGKSWKHVRL